MIANISYVETAWELFYEDKVDVLVRTAVTMLKVPAISEHAFPFAVLFGSITVFVIANRRLEVVAARAAGISLWQFLLPGTVVNLLIGIFAVTVYIPLAVMAHHHAGTLGRVDQYKIEDSRLPIRPTVASTGRRRPRINYWHRRILRRRARPHRRQRHGFRPAETIHQACRRGDDSAY